MTLRVGTASWTDKSLIACGRFYPPGTGSAEARLRYYASQFPLVEVDSSYYAMPKPEVAQLWAERTPQDFTFNIKAFRLFTGHQTSTAALPKDVAEALGPVEKRNLYYKDLPREVTDEIAIVRLRARGDPIQDNLARPLLMSVARRIWRRRATGAHLWRIRFFR